MLIVEDDEEDLALLKTVFTSPDFLVRGDETGEKGLECAFSWRPDVIILDLGLPGISGIEVCRLLKQDARTKSVPILVLSGQSGKERIILALNTGADDYMTKPFSTGELIARIHALLRRRPPARLEEPVLKFGPLSVDLEARSVLVGKRPVSLSPKEFDLLEALVRSKGKILSRQHLLETIWGYDRAITPRTVDNHVSSLRKKLGPPLSKSIQTIFKSGYSLRL